ncbi:MAG: DUF4386 domain-containing protein [Pseudomonadota bacterium]
MNQNSHIPSRRTATFTGVFLLLFTILSALHFTLIELKLIVVDDIEPIVAFIQQQELLFRFGIVLDLTLFTCGIAAVLALYALLRTQHEHFARFALICMVIQATLSIAIELSSLLALLLVSGGNTVAAFEPKQLHALLGLVLQTRAAAYTVVILFFSIGMSVFSFLLLKSKLVPSLIAVTGLLSFVVMLVATLAGLLTPANTPLAANIVLAGQSFATLAMVFQLVLGGWLIGKGAGRRALGMA